MTMKFPPQKYPSKEITTAPHECGDCGLQCVAKPGPADEAAATYVCFACDLSPSEVLESSE